jgi:regulator of ribosome biosynthesis
MEQSDLGPLHVLPVPTNNINPTTPHNLISFPLPRANPLPQPKPLTKWEKFAKEKGIKKKKRERMIYDEDHQEYRPRFGYKRTNSGTL